MKYLLITFSVLLPYSILFSQSSMSPVKVSRLLNTMTTSTLLNKSEAEDLYQLNKCRLVVKDRYYAAPVGFTAKRDVKNAAKGIDEWVQLDNGNAFILTNYKWINFDGLSTQLQLQFDTLICDEDILQSS